MTACRLLIDAAATGSWNMAVDEALLESVAADGGSCLRFYRWKPATLSLGYFQALDDRARHAASKDCAVVRRATGGGAIVHDQELTYSLVTRVSASRTGHAGELYQRMHQSVVRMMKHYGVEAEWAQGRPRRQEPFLCFQRRAAGDLVVGGHKIMGSAQRKRRSAVLQHGSLLLSRSASAPELPGLEDLVGHGFPALLERWTRCLGSEFAWDLEPSVLTAQERQRATFWETEKYAQPGWNERR